MAKLPVDDLAITHAFGPHLSARTRAVVLCTPSNPTGATIRPDEGRRIVRELAARGIVVLSDETYLHFIYDGTHYAIHHFRMSSRWGRWIKRHHMIHHHTGAHARWGVSSPLWDWVFGTMGDSKAEDRG